MFKVSSRNQNNVIEVFLVSLLLTLNIFSRFYNVCIVLFSSDRKFQATFIYSYKTANEGHRRTQRRICYGLWSSRKVIRILIVNVNIFFRSPKIRFTLFRNTHENFMKVVKAMSQMDQGFREWTK